MSQPGDKSDRKRSQYAFNLTLAAVAGQVGCLTLVIVLVALFGGLWLDNLFGTRPWLTVILMVGSVPVTLVAMFWVVRKATSRMTPGSVQKTEGIEEESERERESRRNP
jgi:F0F1-type ATP synthase assembly protein I